MVAETAEKKPSGAEKLKKGDFIRTNIVDRNLREEFNPKSNNVENEGKNKLSESEEYTGIKSYFGIILSLLGSFCFAAVVLFVKLLKDYEFESVGVTFWKYTGITIMSLPLVLFCHWRSGDKKQVSVFHTLWPVFENDNWKAWLGLLMAGTFGAISNVIRYYALQYMSVGDLIVVLHCTPVLITIMAHFTLGEKCGIVHIVIAFTTLIGALIVTKPPILTVEESLTGKDSLIGAALAFGSVIIASFATILTRKFRAVHYALMTLVFGIVGLVESAILYQAVGHNLIPEGLWDSILLLGIASLSFVSMMSRILALKFEQAAVVTLVRNCDVVFGFGLQFSFLNLLPDIYSLIGTLIVLVGVAVITLRKYIETLPNGDKRKSTWSWVMK